jgi:MFS family permease
VIASLLTMRLKPNTVKRAATSMATQMKEGWAYVSTFHPIRTILLLFAVMSLMGMPYMVLLPIFAGRVLHGGAHTLGMLTGASGVGALSAALMLAARKSVRGLVNRIQMAALVFGGGLVLFSFSHWLWLSMLLMVPVGFGMMTGLAGSNTIIQTLVTEDKRTRVMSYYTMAFVGMMPFGSLFGGWLANHIGAPHAVLITGGCCVLAGVWFSFELPSVKKAMRPIYIEKGILPPEPETA